MKYFLVLVHEVAKAFGLILLLPVILAFEAAIGYWLFAEFTKYLRAVK